jgi:hypothetical protein
MNTSTSNKLTMPDVGLGPVMVSFHHNYGERVRRAYVGEKCGFEDVHRRSLVNKWPHLPPNVRSQTSVRILIMEADGGIELTRCERNHDAWFGLTLQG